MVKRRLLATVLGITLCLSLAGGVAATHLTAEDRSILDRIQTQIVEVAGRIRPSVVHIEAIVRRNQRILTTRGSGIISSEDGYILTNRHVIHQAEEVTVTIPDDPNRYRATIVGSDSQTDMALLKIDALRGLSVPPMGDSTALQVGEWVLAIGNPYGLDGSVSLGIVSAKKRNLDVGSLINEFIQTDALIDFGSSGGPLVNFHGEVVGINSRGQGRGIGFTIPIETALDVQRRFLEEGRIERGWLGVTLQPLDRDLARVFGIPDQHGAIVSQVLEDSPAEESGLLAGDIITRFDDQDVSAEEDRDLRDFQRLIASAEVGSIVELVILREGEEVEFGVQIGRQPLLEGKEVESPFGFNVSEITLRLSRGLRLNSRDGVVVTFVDKGSIASQAKLERGDVIKAIQSTPILDVATFEDVMTRMDGEEEVLMTIERGKDIRYILLRP